MNQIARKVGDPDIPRPWSRHSLKKQEKLVEEKKKATIPKSSSLKKTDGEKKENENDDPQLEEFLQVMQPRVKSKLWANDTLAAPPMESGKTSNKKIKVKGGVKKKLVPMVDTDEAQERENGSLDGSSESESSGKPPRKYIPDEVVSDMDYFKSRVKKEWSDLESGDDDDDDTAADDGTDDESEDHDDDKSFEKSKGGQDAKKMDQKGQLDTVKRVVSEEAVEEGSSVESDDDVNKSGNPSSTLVDEKEVLETGRLFVRNLPYTATYESSPLHSINLMCIF